MPSVTQVLRSIGRRLGLRPGTPASRAGVEQPSAWYDDAFQTDEGYGQPYPRSHYYFIWTVIADRLRRARLRRVLEIGCGPGQLAALLMDQGVEGYAGLDFSPVAIKMAQANVPGGRFVVDDARTTSIFAEFEHDAIVCTEVLEHIEDDLLVVSRFGAGTRCLCTVPNFPYESHVRHFRDAAEVAARYGPFFRDLDVAAFRGAQADVYFLFDGIRNGYRPS